MIDDVMSIDLSRDHVSSTEMSPSTSLSVLHVPRVISCLDNSYDAIGTQC